MNEHTNSITVVIADDHKMIIEGFALMVSKLEEVSIVASASNGYELIEAVDKWQPLVVVTDVQMKKLNGIEATKQIKARFPNVKVIGLSSFDEGFLIMGMKEAGADGYLLKNVSAEELLTAFHTVLKGEQYYCAEASEKLKYLEKDNLNSEALTERETEVMKGIVEEKSSKQMADEMCISTRTLEKHRYNLQKKIGKNTIAGIVNFARKIGIAKED